MPSVVSAEVGLREADVIQDAEDAEDAEDEKRQFDWAREERKLIGTLAHRLIERISKEWTGEWTGQGAGAWTPSRVESMSGAFAEKLSAMGVGQEKLAGAVADVVAAGKAVLEDERGRWIVAAHEDAHSEYELGGVLDGKVERRTIDRTLIDERGVRWIVDYKVSSHSGDVEAAQRWHLKLFPLCRDMLGLSTNPVPVKTAMRELGRDTGELRLPMTPLDDSQLAFLRNSLATYGLAAVAV